MTINLGMTAMTLTLMQGHDGRWGGGGGAISVELSRQLSGPIG